MPEFLIDALDDPRLDAYRDLKQAGARRQETFVAEGEKLVRRLLDSPCCTLSIVCTAAMRDRLYDCFPANTASLRIFTCSGSRCGPITISTSSSKLNSQYGR